MILRALYDYYERMGNLPLPGREDKQIGFVIVLSRDGKFLRLEDCRNAGHKTARTFNVPKAVGRSSGVAPNMLYDNAQYVLGYAPDKKPERVLECFNAFAATFAEMQKAHTDSIDLRAITTFYAAGRDAVLASVQKDPLWDDVARDLAKKYSFFSFRIKGDLRIVAEKAELLPQSQESDTGDSICLVTGQRCQPVSLTYATPIAGGKSNGKLVAFQVSSGYDSYGKEQALNAPMSEDASFKFSTALSYLLRPGSRNVFRAAQRTFVFWSSKADEAAAQAEDSLYALLGYTETEADDPNANIENVRKVFTAIASGVLRTSTDDRFYILALAPNAARIAVTYWAECPLRDFAAAILRHFDDMDIIDTRKEKRPYQGLHAMLKAVTLKGKVSDAQPSLPEAIARSIFQTLPYPATLYTACLRRIRAGDPVNTVRAAILKACLNRQTTNPITKMLDTNNTNTGYLCGRLFAVCVKIQSDITKGNVASIRERYMSAASGTPATVFPAVLNLSQHHSEKLHPGASINSDRLKQSIIALLPPEGFPAHLSLQDQGRFFVGYYHQMQALYTKKEDNE